VTQEPRERPPQGLLVPTRLPECGPHLDRAEVCEVWFWDGDFDRVLAHVHGEAERWLVEKGVLRHEDGWHDGTKDLLVGDVVYRIRTADGLGRTDHREAFFDWFYVDVMTGAEQPRSTACREPWGAIREPAFGSGCRGGLVDPDEGFDEEEP